jgi:hypothetical protein
MKRDLIDEIGIDAAGRLYVRPRESTFPLIYREGREVHWDDDNAFLYGPPPRRWGYIQWYRQIISVAAAQGVNLEPHPKTTWVDVPEGLRNAIGEIHRSA